MPTCSSFVVPYLQALFSHLNLVLKWCQKYPTIGPLQGKNFVFYWVRWAPSMFSSQNITSFPSNVAWLHRESAFESSMVPQFYCIGWGFSKYISHKHSKALALSHIWRRWWKCGSAIASLQTQWLSLRLGIGLLRVRLHEVRSGHFAYNSNWVEYRSKVEPISKLSLYDQLWTNIILNV